MKMLFALYICVSFFSFSYGQKIFNGDLEAGNLSAWNPWSPSGTVSIITGNAHTGTYSVQETGNEVSIEQSVSNLKPNTTYLLTGWVKVAASGQTALLGVKYFNGTSQQLSTTATSINYTWYNVKFKTGINNTDATVYLYKQNSGTVYGDDFTIVDSAANIGFEANSLSPWTPWNASGTTSTVTNNAQSGSIAMQETGGLCSAERSYTNLQPNQKYIFTGWAKVSTPSESVMLGVKNFDGTSAQANTTVTSTSYNQYYVPFTTGANNTSVTAFLYKPNNGTAYGDDFQLLGPIPDTATANTNYYLDPTNGNDNNNGKSITSAWKSLNKINSIYFLPGDSILLKYNGAWTGTFQPQGSGIAGRPIVISRYGGYTSMPIINGNGALNTVLLTNQQYIEITNLEITNTANAGQKKRGIEIQNIDQGKLTHIVIRNNYIHDIAGDNIKDINGSEGILVVCRAYASTPIKSWYDSVKIENNRVVNANRTAICVVSDWYCRSSVGCSDGLAWTPSTNVAIRNNYVENAGGDGIVIEETKKGIVEYNLLNGANINSNNANAGIWAWDADNTLFQFNEVYNIHTDWDSQAYDIDYGQDSTIYQYNYSHDNGGGFLLVCSGTTNGNTNGIVRYNISQNDLARIMRISGLVTGTKIYNNTFYLPSGSTSTPLWGDSWNGYASNIDLSNNIYYLAGARAWEISSQMQYTFRNNIVYGVHTTGEPVGTGKITTDPKLVSPGSGTTGSLVNNVISFGNVNGYKLRSGSPAIGTGILIANNGGRDYWGNSVSSTTAPNIGAYQGVGEAVSNALSSTNTIQNDNFMNKLSTFKLYPNPAKSYINISGGTIGNNFNIINSNGQVMLKSTIQLTPINISSFAPGVYFIQIIKSDNKIESLKFIKE